MSLSKYVQILIDYSLYVKEDDIVVIESPVSALPMVRECYKQIMKRGANPILSLTDEYCSDLFYENAKENQLKYYNKAEVEQVKLATKWLTIWNEENTKRFTKVDHNKITMSSEAQKPINDLWLERICATGKPEFLARVGAQYPLSIAAAQEAEMSLLQYEEFVYNASFMCFANPIDHWKHFEKTQNSLIEKLSKFELFRITTAKGTDICFSVPKTRKWLTCAGKENFPDGEVYTTPLETFTEGKIVFDFPSVYDGVEVSDVVLVFKNGEVVDYSCGKNHKFLSTMLGVKGGRVLGELAFGLNRQVKQYTKNILFDEKIGGTFHVALGSAYTNTGGTNDSTIHWDMVCGLENGGKIYGDDNLIFENGEWQIEKSL
ncbi:MAG: aminopeptidase [Candidatus Woesearchaeota archaeon]|jgi:aminopeptidase